MTDYTLGDTLYIAFTTRSFSTGAPTQLAGTPAVSAYEDASLTQITAGITLGVDHDSVTGLNMVTVVATSGNGYSTAKDYHLVITTGTVGGVPVVGEVVGRFTLSRSAAAVDLANGTDGLGAIKTDTGTTIPALLPAALVGGRIDANVGAISTSATAADNLERGALALVLGAASGTPSTTSIPTDLSEATDDHYKGRIVTFTSGALAGQSSDITAYTGSTATLTVTALTEAPAAADTFVIS